MSDLNEINRGRDAVQAGHARDRRIVQSAQAGGDTQGDSADEVGVSQATVPKVVRSNGSEMGKGTRSDLRRSRTRR